MSIKQPAEQPLYRSEPHSLGLFGNSHIGYQKLVGSDRLIGDLLEIHHLYFPEIVQKVTEIDRVTFNG